jgi:hypothetical protein
MYIQIVFFFEQFRKSRAHLKLRISSIKNLKKYLILSPFVIASPQQVHQETCFCLHYLFQQLWEQKILFHFIFSYENLLSVQR